MTVQKGVTGVRRAGDRAAVLDVDFEPASVAAGIRELAARSGLALSEVVPGAATVFVAAPDAASLAHVLKLLPDLIVRDNASSGAEAIEIPVRYDGADLSSVARDTGLAVERIIRLHTQVTYHATFTGFAPGFAYLSGLDPRLRLPRRSSPRPAVPAGSVAIADTYSAVYPRSSPGGWHLLGTTDAAIFDPDREPPALLPPGALVRFVPVPNGSQ